MMRKDCARMRMKSFATNKTLKFIFNATDLEIDKISGMGRQLRRGTASESRGPNRICATLARGVEMVDSESLPKKKSPHNWSVKGVSKVFGVTSAFFSLVATKTTRLIRTFSVHVDEYHFSSAASIVYLIRFFVSPSFVCIFLSVVVCVTVNETKCMVGLIKHNCVAWLQKGTHYTIVVSYLFGKSGTQNCGELSPNDEFCGMDITPIERSCWWKLEWPQIFPNFKLSVVFFL